MTRETWVDGAAGSLHDVDNLPYGVFSTQVSRVIRSPVPES